MTKVVPLLLIVLSLSAAAAAAEAASPQPLDRAGCEDAGLFWNDSANVCDVSTGGTEEAAAATGQPLTRAGCVEAGMRWDDFANVCRTSEEETTTEAEATPSAASKVTVAIDKGTQAMVVSVDGEKLHEWPVSTGLPRYSTPSGEFTASSMNKMWYSKEWDDAPMPHAIFFTRKGHAIHGTNEVSRLGKPASHGCVRLSPQNAETLFTLVADKGLENTEVVLSGETPGRDAYLARSSAQKSQGGRAARDKRKASSSSGSSGAYSLASPDAVDVRPKKRRRGFLRGLFGGR